ncbi:MAG: CapA family protein [Ruminococcaceae bacterium]|nr:CapA family protein [Oscillospiraceae bacterium]
MIIFLGDVALISKKMSSQYRPKYPYVFNLEYVIGKQEDYIPKQNKINLYSEESNFDEIFGFNPNAVGIANNHIYDYQDAGFENTISIIEEKQIHIVGTSPCYVSDDLCLMAYMDLGVTCDFSIHRETFIKNIEKLRSQNPNVRIVVQMHWGVEHHPKQSAEQTELAHWLIDNGVDLVIGHHPHCIQPIEQYKGKYIFYSLGNALFGDINQPSHYDENGVSKRKYRVKWQGWSRKSLAVTYDEVTNTVIDVEELYQTKNVLHSTGKKVDMRKITKCYTGKFSKLRYIFRKYYLFFVSNSFVDQKVFDLNALRSEVKKNG